VRRSSSVLPNRGRGRGLMAPAGRRGRCRLGDDAVWPECSPRWSTATGLRARRADGEYRLIERNRLISAVTGGRGWVARVTAGAVEASRPRSAATMSDNPGRRPGVYSSEVKWRRFRHWWGKTPKVLFCGLSPWRTSPRGRRRWERRAATVPRFPGREPGEMTSNACESFLRLWGGERVASVRSHGVRLQCEKFPGQP